MPWWALFFAPFFFRSRIQPAQVRTVHRFIWIVIVVDQYLSSKTNTAKVILDPAEKQNQFIVKYNECGRTVKGRTISLKDYNNKIVKKWSFEGASTGYQESMTLAVKDILAMKPNDLT